MMDTTHWSVVIAAGQSQSPQSDSALATLCETYWYPLYVFVRRQGFKADQRKYTTGFSHAIQQRLVLCHINADLTGPAQAKWRNCLEQGIQRCH